MGFTSLGPPNQEGATTFNKPYATSTACTWVSAEEALSASDCARVRAACASFSARLSALEVRSVDSCESAQSG